LPATLTALSKTVFGSDGAENYEGQRLQFSRAGLSVPGLVASPENPHYTVKFVGLARSVRADRQAKVLQFFQAQQH
jgi:2'-5' RNA ligase